MTIPASVLDSLEVQYLAVDGVTWTTFGRLTGLGSILRSRRFALPPGESVTAQHWRVIKTGATDWGTAVIRLDQIAFWAENDALDDDEVSQVKLAAFNFDDDSQRYIIPMTAGGDDIWRQSEYMNAAISPYSGDQLSLVTRTQLLDTMLNFHTDVASVRIMRQGSHTEWDSRPLSFDSLPIYDYDGTAIGGVDEVQQLFFVDYTGGDTFNITLEDQTTGPIAYSAVTATLSASIATALEALPNVGVGQIAVTNVATDTYQVTFQGKMANSDVGTMAPVTLHSTAGGVSVANITQGKGGGEAIISTSRGWPASGCFYQQRLYLAGLKGRPETFLGSQIGSYFALDTAGADAAGAINENIDTEEVTAIRAIFAGRHLQMFTNSAEFYFPNEPITPPTAVRQATRRGVEPGTPQFTMDLSTVFIGPGGNSLYEYAFQYFQDNYSATNLAVDASHIVQGVIDAGYRKHQSTSDADLAVMPRSNGDAVVMVALRDQEVTGFVPWTTQGRFLASVAEMGGDIYVATARVLHDGSTARFLERLDATRFLDCSTYAALGDDALVDKVLTVGEQFNGLTFALYIDGADAGDAVVADGTVTLPATPLVDVEAGLLFQPSGATLPFVFEKDPRSGASMNPRVGEIAFRLGPTSNLKAGIVGGKLWRVPLKKRPNALLDYGPGEDAFTGWTRLWGVAGFQPDAQLQWVQERPGPLLIQEIVATITS